MKNNEWIPVNSGLFPQEKENVQVTYIGYNDGKPYCDVFAYYCYKNNKWYWTDNDSEARVKITAWKYNCKPYIGE